MHCTLCAQFSNTFIHIKNIDGIVILTNHNGTLLNHLSVIIISIIETKDSQIYR